MGVGSIFRNSSSEVTNNRSVGVEEVIAGHARFAWNTSRNDNDLDTIESLRELFLCITDNFTGGINMTDVGSDTRSTSDVVET